ncbi:MAG: cation:proton antiporter [Burkholderiaceae bacterium]
MLVFESLLALLLCAALLANLARRLDIPYPVLLALGGAALAFVPGMPAWTLRPDLALFIAPVPLDAAYDSSPRDLKDNWAPLVGLVFVAVVLTTIAVAVLARWLVPEMPWAVAIALGAIVAPPDAAAATAVLRQAHLPHRLLTILEGESLLNDASSLLIYRVAVAAALGGDFVPAKVAPLFAYAVVGSIVFGVVAAWPNARLIRRIQDAPTSIIMQFGSTFAIWIVAERIGLSGILTIVVYAIVIARTAPLFMPARLRVPSLAFWETAVFILKVFAFVLIGLQIRPIWNASTRRFAATT